MAIYRHVHVEFWKDPKVLEELTPEDKLFFIYLLTNPNTTQIGVYKITKKQIAFELGFSIESVNVLMDRFINNYGLIKYNSDTREICIKNWGKYNLNKLGKPMLDCVKSELKNVDDKSLLEFIKPSISKEEIVSLFDEVIFLDKVNDDKYDDKYPLSTQNKNKKEKENKNKKENKNIEDSENGYNTKTTRKSKHTLLYEKEDNYIYKKPSEEQLRYASKL